MSASHRTGPQQRRRGRGAVILGAGRLGTHLAILLSRAGCDPVHLWNRTRLDAGRRTRLQLGKDVVVHAGGALPREALGEAGVVLLTVSDGAIEPLATRIVAEVGTVPCPVLHCSGALPGQVLAPLAQHGTPVGSLHPLHSFTWDGAMDGLSGTWFVVEGDPEAIEAGTRVAERLGGRPLAMDARAKTTYHAAAVMASNLLVSLVSLAVEVLARELGGAVSPETLLHMFLPLVKGTVSNLEQVGLPDALTGPVSRGDRMTITRHLAALSQNAHPDTKRAFPARAEDAGSDAGNAQALGGTAPSAPAAQGFAGRHAEVVYRILSLQAVALAARQGLPAETCQALRRLLMET